MRTLPKWTNGHLPSDWLTGHSSSTAAFAAMPAARPARAATVSSASPSKSIHTGPALLSNCPKSTFFTSCARFTWPVALTALEIKPYVADEIFYNFNADRLNGHRVQAGLFVPLHEKIRLELFYFWHIHEEDDSDWSDVNVIGSYFRFQF